jgi:hypothetical protein
MMHAVVFERCKQALFPFPQQQQCTTKVYYLVEVPFYLLLLNNLVFFFLLRTTTIEYLGAKSIPSKRSKLGEVG